MPGIDETENSWRVRQTDPGKYIRLRIGDWPGPTKGVKVVFGFLKGGGSEIQSVIFDKKHFPTKEDVKNWFRRNKKEDPDFKLKFSEEDLGEIESIKEFYCFTNGSDFEPDGALFVKEIARVGKFKSAEGKIVEFTKDLFRGIVKEFKKSEGDVPVPLEHKGLFNPLSNLGWVKEIFIKGDSLFGKFDITNPDAIASIKNKSIKHNSIGLVKEAGKWILEHIALTNLPVITGMKTFEPVAFSGSDVPEGVEFLSYSKLEEEEAKEPDVVEIQNFSKEDDLEWKTMTVRSKRGRRLRLSRKK